MLILKRGVGDGIDLGPEIKLVVISIEGNRVRLGIQTPEGVLVIRGELERFPDPQ